MRNISDQAREIRECGFARAALGVEAIGAASLQAQPAGHAEPFRDDQGCARAVHAEGLGDAGQGRRVVRMRKMMRAAGADEAACDSDTERLRLGAPLGERMGRRIVGIVKVAMLDVHAASAHEPGRDLQRGTGSQLQLLKQCVTNLCRK